MSLRSPIRIAVVVSHPIQHFAPWHREVAALPGIQLTVFFCLDWGANAYFDKDFGREVKWDIPLLEGYEHEFLPVRRKTDKRSFWSVDNPAIAKALDAFKPDVVQVFGYAYRTMWRARSWCMENGVPLILFSDSNDSVRRPWWKEAAKAVIVRRFYRGVSGALVAGDNNRAYHRHYGVQEDRLFPGCLPIDARALLSSTGDIAVARQAVRQNYGISADAFTVVMSGKLTRGKSPIHLAQAMTICRERGLNVFALFVGDGEQRSAIETFVTSRGLDRVKLAGFVNQSEIGKYYAASDAIVSTSFLDNHPLIVPEAGCFGLPLIASDRLGCIGPTDSARPNDNALIYPWGDIEKLAAHIETLATDRALYQRLSGAARTIAASQDVSVAARQLKQAAEALCGVPLAHAASGVGT
jgi:glycosyltransferase involved in cell wall biosynthesis